MDGWMNGRYELDVTAYRCLLMATICNVSALFGKHIYKFFLMRQAPEAMTMIGCFRMLLRLRLRLRMRLVLMAVISALVQRVRAGVAVGTNQLTLSAGINPPAKRKHHVSQLQVVHDHGREPLFSTKIRDLPMSFSPLHC
jgi:hypothetical protein